MKGEKKRCFEIHPGRGTGKKNSKCFFEKAGQQATILFYHHKGWETGSLSQKGKKEGKVNPPLSVKGGGSESTGSTASGPFPFTKVGFQRDFVSKLTRKEEDEKNRYPIRERESSGLRRGNERQERRRNTLTASGMKLRVRDGKKSQLLKLTNLLGRTGWLSSRGEKKGGRFAPSCSNRKGEKKTQRRMHSREDEKKMKRKSCLDQSGRGRCGGRATRARGQC